MLTGIIYSSDNYSVDVCFDCCSEIGIGLVKQSDFTNFIFKLQQDPFDVIFFDSEHLYKEWLKYIKIIKSIKPKVPLIFISDKVETSEGGKIYEEGIFHLAQKPLNKEIIKEVITASIKNLSGKRY